MASFQKILFLSLGVLILTAIPALALELPSGGDSYTVNLTPGIPGPNTKVTANVVSYNFDVNGAYFIWTLNGTTIERGYGKKSISFTTGDAQTVQTLVVSITPSGGIAIEKTIIISINDVDLLWQADTYVPAWFAGKPMPARKSATAIMAIPHLYRNGLRLNPNELIYEWRLGSKTLVAESGFNKQALNFTFDGVTKLNHEITVTVSDVSKTASAIKTIILYPADPEILFYKNNPLEGPLYRKAIVDFKTVPGAEHQFIAVPFYFSADDPAVLDYQWTAGSESNLGTSAQPYFFDFRSSPEASGVLNIGLAVRNLARLFQQGAGSFRITIE